MRKTNDKKSIDDENLEKTTEKQSKIKSVSKNSKTKESKSSTKKASSSVKKTSAKTSTKKSTTAKSTSSTTKKSKETPSKTTKKTTASKKNSIEPKKSSTTKKTSSVKKSSTKKTSKPKIDIEAQSITTNMDISKMEERLKALQKTSEELKVLKETQKNSNIQNSKTVSSKSQTPEHEKKHLDNSNSVTELKNNNQAVSSSKTVEKLKTTKKENQKKSKNFIYNSIIAICLVLIVYSSVNIILWHKNNIDNSKMVEQVTQSTPVSKVEEVSISDTLEIEKKDYDLSDLLNQNPDTVGWINVPNTQINYPVVKGTDNEFYLKHSFDKSYNAAGWIYADYRNNFDGTDQNLIIYGHNRLNNNMFGTLENTLTTEWQSLETNHYITLSTLEKSQLYNVFSVFICTSEESENYLQTDFTSTENYKNYIDTLKNLSNYDFNTTLNSDDKILTLYTCHGLNNERLIVCCKLIV